LFSIIFGVFHRFANGCIATGNQTVGKPSRPDFLLQPGELLRAAAGLRIVAYEDGFLTDPERYVQRLAAVRETASSGVAPRYPL
jgi:hypothetical protein